MAKRHLTAGAVIFRIESGRQYFLLIKNAKGHWDFPKWHIEKGETRISACRREVREETGIDKMSIVPGFIEKRRWSFKEDGIKSVKDCWFFLAEAESKRIRLSKEHSKGGWYPVSAGLRLLKYPGQRSLLRQAGKIISCRHS